MLYRRIQMEKRNLLQDLWDYNIIICLLRAKLITKYRYLFDGRFPSSHTEFIHLAGAVMEHFFTLAQIRFARD